MTTHYINNYNINKHFLTDDEEECFISNIKVKRTLSQHLVKITIMLQEPIQEPCLLKLEYYTHGKRN